MYNLNGPINFILNHFKSKSFSCSEKVYYSLCVFLFILAKSFGCVRDHRACPDTLESSGGTNGTDGTQT